MKLGIIVVYMLTKENETLADIHLDFIEKHTSVPYTIYCIIKSPTSEEYHQKLLNNPHIKEFDLPRIDWGRGDKRASYEHSLQLRRITDLAVKDDISHIAVLHADSFPVKSGWELELDAHLNDQCVLAAIKRIEDHDLKPHCSGMFFRKEFYTKYQPTYRLSEQIMKKRDYREYFKINNGLIIPDTGVGFGYRLWLEKLDWHPLLRSNKRQDHSVMGGIYGDTFFHVGAAVRPLERDERMRAARKVSKNKLYSDPAKYIDYLRGL